MKGKKGLFMLVGMFAANFALWGFVWLNRGGITFEWVLTMAVLLVLPVFQPCSLLQESLKNTVTGEKTSKGSPRFSRNTGESLGTRGIWCMTCRSVLFITSCSGALWHSPLGVQKPLSSPFIVCGPGIYFGGRLPSFRNNGSVDFGFAPLHARE